MKSEKLSLSIWTNLIMFGLMGQIAWNVENVYFNTFLYNSIYNVENVSGVMSVTSAVNIMVALSAATAVITTFIMGTLSDKVNRRKIFIAVGYIAWGLVTASFGLISVTHTQELFHIADSTKALAVTAWIVIGMDCLMTFMGSTSNDSAFNAWVTDVTTESNRQRVETVLAVLPIAAMGIVAGLGAVVVNVGYTWFFIVLGGIVCICGVIGLFTIKDSLSGVKKETNYWSDLVYGFRPSVVKENSNLYLAFSAICVFGLAVQVFFPYLIIYVEKVILPNTENLLSAQVIICAVLSLLIMGAGLLGLLKFSEKIGRENVIIIASVCFVAGLFMMGFVKEMALFILFAAPVVIGYALLLITLNASIRDLTPVDKVGQFQGIRMIFYVLLPMVIGPTVGNITTLHSSITYLNDYGKELQLPTSVMFICASAIALLVFIPALILKKRGIHSVSTKAEVEACSNN